MTELVLETDFEVGWGVGFKAALAVAADIVLGLVDDVERGLITVDELRTLTRLYLDDEAATS